MADRITVIGSANTDLVIHSPKMPLLGETLTGSNFQINAGGKGLNQAVAISKLGGRVSFLGSVGNDSNGAFLLEQLSKSKVDFKGIKDADTSTGIAMITVVNGNNFIVINPGANNKLTPAIIDENEALIAESGYCVMQLEIPVETVARVCEIAKKHGTKTVLNPAPCRKLPDGLLSGIDYLIPNEHEARDITGIYPDDEESCRKAISKLKEYGVGNVIITLGERGCAYTDGDKIVFRAAEKADVVDTTSAGDCFIGALISKLSRNEGIKKAVDFATKAAAIAVSREGASASIPFEEEVR